MPKLCLSMIVKNETHIIKECFDTVYKNIDYWVIVDTGSTDGTQELIKQYFAEKGIPGELHERPWVGFGHNRSEALELCNGKADWAWMIDADDYIEGNLELPLNIPDDVDGWALKFARGEFEWWRTQIFRTGRGWKYMGILHEYPTIPDNQPKIAKLDSNYKIVARTLGARNKDISPIEKYSKDAELLEEALKTEPDNIRYQFYLAQSYFDSQQWEKAEAAYVKRVQMGGWEEEQFYAAFRIGLCRGILNKPWLEIQQAFLEAWEIRPNRAEPLHQISRVYRHMGHPRLAYLYAKMALDIPYPQDDILFVSADVYKFGILDEVASTAFYANKPHIGYAACKKLLTENLLPESEVERVQNNFNQYLKFFEQTNQMHLIEQLNDQVQKQSERKDHKPALFPAQLPKPKKFKDRKAVSR
jgi:glycosyltransferase involved in cell wall biosynthesis